jgi:hypothetical protein
VLAEAVEHRAGPWTVFFETVAFAAEVPLAVLARRWRSGSGCG